MVIHKSLRTLKISMVKFPIVYSGRQQACGVFGSFLTQGKYDIMSKVTESRRENMSMTYKTIEEESTGELVEKKSRFIAYVAPVSSEQEAYAFVDRIKKKHYDARHNCFAFSVGAELPLLRFSDDGEPQGTAGKPILEVINGADVKNICIVVTRYFGGTLLGTGGLVRAYTDAAKIGLERNRIITRQQVQGAEFVCDYTDFGKLQYMLASMEIPIADTVYEEQVTVGLKIPAERVLELEKKITETTSARVVLTKKGDLYWA